MENENVFEEVKEVKENKKEGKEMEETKNNMVVSSINDITNVTRSKTNVFTTIKDNKMLFNLETNVDNKINDCVGETIRVKDILIKLIETPLEEPVLNEAGEIEREFEYKKITILIDDKNKSYVTASKVFANDFIKYLQMVGMDDFIQNGVDIKIIKKNVRNSSNQALSFELV